jgi:hypothetical protein
VEDYGRSRVLPFFFFEGTYENEGADAVCLRGQAYTSILSGSVGHLLGNRPVWLFDPGWQAELDSPGSLSMVHLRALFRSRPWERLVPDLAHDAVIGGTDGVAAALASDGGSLIAYGPSPRTLTVDLTRLSGSEAQGWWFDPASGAAQALGSFPSTGPSDFDPPGGSDWVLVLDDAALGYGAPGSEPVDTVPPAAPGNLSVVLSP